MIDEPAGAFFGADVRPVVDVLWAHWPAFRMLSPADVGMDQSPARVTDFVRVVQQLSDAGLICYEALVVRGGDVRLVDAALTARGRAQLAPWIGEERNPLVRFARRA